MTIVKNQIWLNLKPNLTSLSNDKLVHYDIFIPVFFVNIGKFLADFVLIDPIQIACNARKTTGDSRNKINRVIETLKLSWIETHPSSQPAGSTNEATPIWMTWPFRLIVKGPPESPLHALLPPVVWMQSVLAMMLSPNDTWQRALLMTLLDTALKSSELPAIVSL